MAELTAYRNYVAGEFRATDQTIPVENPATGEVLAYAPRATPAGCAGTGPAATTPSRATLPSRREACCMCAAATAAWAPGQATRCRRRRVGQKNLCNSERRPLN